MLAGTNGMTLFVFANEKAGQARLVAALDNLGKGAGGAAVQNLNIMLGLPETDRPCLLRRSVLEARMSRLGWALLAFHCCALALFAGVVPGRCHPAGAGRAAFPAWNSQP